MRELLSEYFITMLAVLCGFIVTILFITTFFGPDSTIRDVVLTYVEGFVK